jgi:predicted dehydrogenase
MSLRLAILGCGQIVWRRHAPAALACEQLQVVALGDAERSRAQQLAEALGWNVRLFERPSDLEGLADAILIATPNAMHAALAIEALRSGLHVLVEKPLALTAQDARAIASVAEEEGRLVYPGHVRRHRTQVDLVRQFVRDELFGTPTRVVYTYGVDASWSPWSRYYGNPGERGVLAVQGPHLLDLLGYWFGPLRAVSARHDGVQGPEANFEGYLEGQHGASSLPIRIRVSHTTPLPSGVVIETTSGWIAIPEGRHETVRFYSGQSDSAYWALEWANEGPDPFVKQLEDFCNACLGRGRPKVSVHDGVAVVELIERLYSLAASEKASLQEVAL